MKKKYLSKDLRFASMVTKEALEGNPDAKYFLSQAQQGLILIALYEQIAKSIQDTATRLSLKGVTDLAIDGKLVANRLFANAKLLRYSIAERIRSGWLSKGEVPLPESKNVLQAKEVIKSPFRLRSTKDDIQTYYGEDARFFLPNVTSDIEASEKKILYYAKHTTPMLVEMVPPKIRSHFPNGSVGTSPFFVSYFQSRAMA